MRRQVLRILMVGTLLASLNGCDYPVYPTQDYDRGYRERTAAADEARQIEEQRIRDAHDAKMASVVRYYDELNKKFIELGELAKEYYEPNILKDEDPQVYSIQQRARTLEYSIQRSILITSIESFELQAVKAGTISEAGSIDEYLEAFYTYENELEEINEINEAIEKHNSELDAQIKILEKRKDELIKSMRKERTI